jgi:hypothetical protein
VDRCAEVYVGFRAVVHGGHPDVFYCGRHFGRGLDSLKCLVLLCLELTGDSNKTTQSLLGAGPSPDTLNVY